MAILVDRAAGVVGRVQLYIRRKIEYMRERLDGFLNRYPVESGTVYSAEEEEVIQKASERIREYFPQTPGESLAGEDLESRCQVIEDLAQDIISIYDLESVSVEITNDPEVFPSGQTTLGLADMQNRVIYINADYIMSDDPMVLNRIVSTVLHELRHIMQIEIMLLQNPRGSSYNRRRIWRLNLVNYIDAAEDYQGYYSQPLEFDARNFANRIWQIAYGKTIQ